MGKIAVNNLTKIYNQNKDNEVRALNGVSFDIENGEFVVILGQSGAGKSTLLNILGGMDSATGGEYFVGDKKVSDFGEKLLTDFRRTDIGFVFQFYNLVPNLTAIENVALAASVVANALDSEEIMKAVGLGERLGNYPSQLSGGEQQRTAIARALVKNPDLLLCDEPTGALDSKTGAQIITLLHSVCRKYDKTVIIVTHNEKIALCAERVITISDGKISKDVKNDNPISPEMIEW